MIDQRQELICTPSMFSYDCSTVYISRETDTEKEIRQEESYLKTMCRREREERKEEKRKEKTLPPKKFLVGLRENSKLGCSLEFKFGRGVGPKYLLVGLTLAAWTR